jgi:C4-dicarboxylate transporter DctQ subunit
LYLRVFEKREVKMESARKPKLKPIEDKMSPAERIFDRVIFVFMAVSCVFVAVLTIIVCYEVIMRTFFNHPSSWVGEYSGHILLYITFMSAAWLLRKEEHVKMDLIANTLGPRRQAFMDIVTSIIGVVVCCITAWFTARVAIEMFQTDYRTQSVLRLPEWPLMSFIPAGFFLLALQFIRRTLKCVRVWKGIGKKEKGEGLASGY